MGRGGSAHRAALPTVVHGASARAVQRTRLYARRYLEPYFGAAIEELTTEAERFVLVTRSTNPDTAHRTAQCHALLTDALTAALCLFRSTDTLVRLLDLGPPDDTNGAVLVLLRVRLRMPSAPLLQRPPACWPEQLRNLVARQNIALSTGIARAPEGPWVLVMEGLSGKRYMQRFPSVTDAGDRLRSLLLSTPTAFVGLWDLAGDDQPVRVDLGLQAQVDNGPAPIVWDK